MGDIGIEFILNHQPQKLKVKPYHTLSQVLRDQLGLTGTKICCEEGECGSCTVILDGKAVTSCMVLAPEIHNGEVVTVEGLCSNGDLDPVQEAFIEEGAIQCGYCIPGMLMSSKALLMDNDQPQEEEIREALAGNLCRCGGYYRIFKAVAHAAEKQKETVKG
jgi:aerobic-type carbon monoxide dehydrogenase small subunit (CoxS/CutS family)